MTILNKVNTRNTSIVSLSLKLGLVLLVAILLLLLGGFTALAPQFIARLLVIPILLLFILFAFLGKSQQSLSENLEKKWLIILIATMALWPSYMLVKFGGLPALDARRVVAGITLLATLYLVISRTPVRNQFLLLFNGQIGVVTWLILAYVGIRFISCFASVAPFYSLTQVFWEVLYYYSMFFVGAILFYRPQLQHLVMNVFMVLAILIGLFAMVEWVAQSNILIQFAPSNEEFSDLQKALEISRIRGGFFRAQGTFEHPLLLGEFSAMAACMGLSVILWKPKSMNQMLGLLTMLVAIISAVLTGSRSAFVSIPISMGLILLVWFFGRESMRIKIKPASRKWLVSLCFVGVSILAIPLLMFLIEGSSRSEAASSAGRFYMLQLGWESIKANPFVGTGPGTSGAVAGIVTGAGVGTLDNYFLAIAIESGMASLLILLAIFLYPVWVIFNQLMSDHQLVNRTFLSSVMGLTIVTVVVHTILWMPYNLFFALILIGMLLSSTRKL